MKTSIVKQRKPGTSKRHSSTLAALLLLACSLAAQPQPLLIDRIVGVVGREMILHSELVVKLEQTRQQGGPAAGQVEACGMFEDLLYEKLLIEQGNLDSVVVEEEQVEQELERRIQYFARQLGGVEELEKFYGKTTAEIKSDFRPQVHDQLLVQNMQQRVTGDIRITPREVKRFYERIAQDSVPFINMEVEYAQVVSVPKPNEEEDRRVRRKMEEFRDAVAKGQKEFCTVAILYSEDPGSASKCGELGMVPAGAMVPEFDAVAMSLKEGEVSQVFKTSYGWHFMQLIERKGEQYNARHVLMRPMVSGTDMQASRNLLDSLAREVRAGRLTFSKAATDFSDDEESKGANGLLLEPNSNSARWDVSMLDQQTAFVLDKLQPGEVSEPQLVVMPDGSKSYRILQLILRTEPHRANLKDDYRLIQQACEGKMRSEAIDAWVSERLEGTYVRIAEEYASCPFMHKWTSTAAGE